LNKFNDTIVAPATPSGVSALAVVRVSGAQAIQIANTCFDKDITNAEGYTIHYGHVVDGQTKVDEVLLSIFKNPHSYTGENSVEISGHGSPYITKRILETLIKSGARMAEPGEFTLRAFLNKKIDLAQAEAVADMISSNSEASLQMALSQMRGGFSNDISVLRQELIDFAALIELENDFGEEDVEFANRPKLKALIYNLLSQIEKLRSSFSAGNVLKNGINTVIAGKPNAGKSTLLNALLNEERAIVSDIEGTTRDTIEEVFTLNGIVHIAFAVVLFATILIFNWVNNDAVISGLFKAAGFTYGPLLGLFAFGILTKLQFTDKHVIAISLLSIALTAGYYFGMPKIIEGFKAGFELIIINGVITFALLFLDSTINKTHIDDGEKPREN